MEYAENPEKSRQNNLMVHSMNFSRKEMTAILKLSIAMMNADGRDDERELKLIAQEMNAFGIDRAKFDTLFEESKNLEANEILSVIKAMDADQKKYVSGYLLAISIVDEDVHDEEVKLWRLVSEFCSFPEISPEDALKYWRTH